MAGYEELREIFALPVVTACRAVDDWLAYASRSKLKPFVKLARTIRRYRNSIEATIEWRLTDGFAESNNTHIGRLRAAARGFHTAKAFITMTYLDRAGITPNLPWTTGPPTKTTGCSEMGSGRRVRVVAGLLGSGMFGCLGGCLPGCCGLFRVVRR